ncbi:hypothetical protein [Leisingera sp.]|uniref:hypothetical protein n=1 Tax=Leisingera sp. TaxID=1879318 RepID=UPI002B26C526|nr:hypothetical protein [Leisingera sp.]
MTIRARTALAALFLTTSFAAAQETLAVPVPQLTTGVRAAESSIRPPSGDSESRFF